MESASFGFCPTCCMIGDHSQRVTVTHRDECGCLSSNVAAAYRYSMIFQTKRSIRVSRWLGWLVISACFVALLFCPTTVWAQSADPNAVPPMNTVMGDSATLPSYWFLIMAAMAIMVPA